MKTFDLARKVVDVLEQKKGENIVLLDVHELASFTDYFVICSGTSDRMLRSLSDAVQEDIKKTFDLNSRVEGIPENGWLVLDLGDIVVHIFAPDEREYYQLEELWEKGKVLLHLQ